MSDYLWIPITILLVSVAVYAICIVAGYLMDTIFDNPPDDWGN